MTAEVDFVKIASLVLALMIAIIGHEIMHGFAAYRYGDTTAKDEGRLSVNPIVHIDPLGTIIVPLLLFLTNAPFLFGWAKPVPIDSYRVLQRGGFFGMFNVSMAGIYFNLAMAFIASFLLGAVDNMFVNTVLFYLVIYNVILALFNLLPIPPLDGSKAISYLGMILGSDKPARFFYKIERYGMVILVIFLISPLNGYFFSYADALIRWMIFG